MNSTLCNKFNILQYGIDLSARTTNIAHLPRRIWGRASRIFANRYALSTRLEVDVQAMDLIDFEIDGEDEDNDMKMRMIGSAGAGLTQLKNARVAFLEFTKAKNWFSQHHFIGVFKKRLLA